MPQPEDSCLEGCISLSWGLSVSPSFCPVGRTVVYCVPLFFLIIIGWLKGPMGPSWKSPKLVDVNCAVSGCLWHLTVCLSWMSPFEGCCLNSCLSHKARSVCRYLKTAIPTGTWCKALPRWSVQAASVGLHVLMSAGCCSSKNCVDTTTQDVSLHREGNTLENWGDGLTLQVSWFYLRALWDIVICNM